MFFNYPPIKCYYLKFGGNVCVTTVDFEGGLYGNLSVSVTKHCFLNPGSRADYILSFSLILCFIPPRVSFPNRFPNVVQLLFSAVLNLNLVLF